MVLKLDPDLPIVWRSLTELQVGIDADPVRLSDVTRVQEHMLGALIGGITLSGLVMIVIDAGGQETDALALVETLGDTVTDTGTVTDIGTGSCTGERHAIGQARVVVDGTGEAAGRIRNLLGASGVLVGDQFDDGACDLAVIVANFTIPPYRYSRWLNRDIPHLPVTFSDRHVQLGPLVEPGDGPCLYCLDQCRTDADPAWPAIASQLLSRTAASHRPMAAADAAVRAVRMVLARLIGGSRQYRATSIRIDATSGAVTAWPHRPHEGCGCRALPENVTAISPVRAAARSGRRRARVDPSPA